MGSDQFCLRWNNFQSNIVSALESLKAEEDLVDVTLTCEGQSVRAHKVILSACSPYFRKVFKENPCQHPVIILKDVSSEDVMALLSFMYQGEVYISQDRLASFLQTAEILQIRGLAGATNPSKDVKYQQQAQQQQQHLAVSSRPSTSPSHSPSRAPLSSASFASTVGSYAPPPPALYQVGRGSSSSSVRGTSPQPKRRKAVPRRVSASFSVPASGSPPLPSAQSSLSAIPLPQSNSPESPSESPTPLSGQASVTATAVSQERSPVTSPNLLSSNIGTVTAKVEPPDPVEDEQRSPYVEEDDDEEDQDVGKPINEHINDQSHHTSLQINTDSSAASFEEDDRPKPEEDSSSLHEDLGMSVLARSLTSGRTHDVQGLFGSSDENPAGGSHSQPGAGMPRFRQGWSSMQPRNCPFCNKTFSNSFNLKQHVINIHMPSEDIVCQICHKTVKNKWYLRKHLVTAHNAPLKRVRTQDGRLIQVSPPADWSRSVTDLASCFENSVPSYGSQY